jgi:hypothetical protein
MAPPNDALQVTGGDGKLSAALSRTQGVRRTSL